LNDKSTVGFGTDYKMSMSSIRHKAFI